ncbi:MAG TPA: TIGR03557 family F420-dependent LLM class oxidoreductase [Steroidobacteraceae bacterium]|nr:TIGR03557 family F420-dependent LLM class oxidoreductase [Steroidobacteraceae bacterium]
MAHFGWKAGTEQYPPGELLEYAIAAEQAGFDSIDASDHFHPWDEQGQACFVWSWLGAAAVRTSRIRLGTGVTCPILRYHPAIIAQAAATIATLAPGRFFLGLGTGEALNEYAATGQWPDYVVRRGQMIEAVRLIRALWKGEPVSHHGHYYQTRQAKLYTRPTEPPPLLISSMVPNSAHLAGEIGDGLITVGGNEPELYRELIGNFESGARSAGKDPASMPRMIELAVSYGSGEAEAIRSRKDYWAGTYIPALFTERIYTPRLSAENGKAVGAEAIREAGCLSADPDEHVRMAQRYLDLGFDHLIFHSAGPDQRAFIAGYGRDVLPRLRRSGAGGRGS